MATSFTLEQVNLLTYLTRPLRAAHYAPRCEVDALKGLLQAFLSPDDAEWNFVDTRPRRALRAEPFPPELAIDRAARALEQLDQQIRAAPETPMLSSATVADLLGPLSLSVRYSHSYAAVVMPFTDGELTAAGREAFEELKRSEILVVLSQSNEEFSEIVDPLPSLQALAAHPCELPAVVFWNFSEAAVIPTNQLPRALDRDRFGGLREELVDLQDGSRRNHRKVFHLSDLHFGRRDVRRQKSYLKNHLSRVLSPDDRVVITGDLFDSPKAKWRDEFDEFRSDVQRMTGHRPHVIPGNHDMRPKGLSIFGLGKNYEPVAGLGWQPLVIDDGLKVIFFCFNSSEGGAVARGSVGRDQRQRMATDLEQLLDERPETSQYRRIALLHHHPIKYPTIPKTMYDKITRLLFRSEDVFVSLDDADEFLSWCAARQVELILHGHKHVPRHCIGRVPFRGSEMKMTIIGCGSTTGAEGFPMSYDVIHLDTASGRWNVSFYYDDSDDGSGFTRQSVVIDLRP